MTTPEAPSSGLLRFLPLAAIAVAMLVAVTMGWHKAITLENIVAVRDRFQGFLAANMAVSLLIYVLVYTAAAALSLPGSLILTLTGGLLFGWLAGGLAALIGATAGATLVFLIARAALAGANLSQLAESRAGIPGVGRYLGTLDRLDKLLEQMRAGFRENALSYLLFLRLVPAFPFWAVNLVAAILSVPFKTYVGATFFGIIPATFAFASVGSGLDSVIAHAKAEYAACVSANGAQACKLSINAGSLVTHELLLAFVLLGLVALIPVVYRKWRPSHAAAK